MKRLIAITTLGLTLSLSSLSFALDHTDMYTKPTAKSEVKDEVKDGNVEADFTSFYINPRPASTTTSSISGQGSDEQYVYVFGVRIER